MKWRNFPQEIPPDAGYDTHYLVQTFGSEIFTARWNRTEWSILRPSAVVRWLDTETTPPNPPPVSVALYEERSKLLDLTQDVEKERLRELYAGKQRPKD